MENTRPRPVCAERGLEFFKCYFMDQLISKEEYRTWLEQVKQKVQAAQFRAALSVNRQLILLYWELGEMIAEKQEKSEWGKAVLDALALDLKNEFPQLSGFSRSNLAYMGQFYRFYHKADEFVQQLVGQIPWGHNILIFSKSDNLETACFYLQATIENNGSRNLPSLP